MIYKKLIFIFCLFVSGVTQGAGLPAETPLSTTPTKEHMLTLGIVDGESSEDLSVVNIRLDQKPAWKTTALEEGADALLIVLPNTIAPHPNQILDAASPYLTKIAIHQTSPTQVTIRLSSQIDPKILRKAAELALIDNRLVLTLDHKTIKSHMPKIDLALQNANTPTLTPVATVAANGPTPIAQPLATQTSVAQTAAPVADTPITTSQPLAIAAPVTPVEHQSPPNSIAEQEQVALASTTNALETEPKTQEDIPLQKILTIFAIFMLLFTCFVGVSIFLRNMIRGSKANHQEAPTTLKLVSQIALSPKVRISLIQVGSEKLLLSVGPEGSQLISHLGQATQHPPHTVGNPSQGAHSKLHLGNTPPVPSKQPQRLNEALIHNSPEGSSHPESFNNMASHLIPPPRERATNAQALPKRATSNLSDTERQKQLRDTLEKLSNKKNQEEAHRVNYAITDDGIVRRNQQSASASPQAIQDVTQIIREKLKSLPKLS